MPTEKRDLVAVIAAFARLSYRERDILLRRYGEPPQTVEEIAVVFRVTPSRIRAIETQALKVLAARLK